MFEVAKVDANTPRRQALASTVRKIAAVVSQNAMSMPRSWTTSRGDGRMSSSGLSKPLEACSRRSRSLIHGQMTEHGRSELRGLMAAMARSLRGRRDFAEGVLSSDAIVRSRLPSWGSADLDKPAVVSSPGERKASCFFHSNLQ